MSLKRFLYADLTARLRKEWPSSFATVSEDCRGFVVAEFHFNRASIEGDVLSYMTKFVAVLSFLLIFTVLVKEICHTGAQVQQVRRRSTYQVQAKTRRQNLGPSDG